MADDKILMVDDDTAIQEVVYQILTNAGFHVFTAGDGASALEKARKHTFSAAVVDLNLPGLSGMDTIHSLKAMDPLVEVIVFTGHPSIESSIDAIRNQVFDYILKPGDADILQRSVGRAVEHRQLIIKNNELMHQLEIERNRLSNEITAAKRAMERRLETSNELVGQSRAIRQIRHFIANVAPSDMTVLILGESGTGKDVVARLIHEMSGRDPNAFVKINCPAIPETLLESELFGHEPGAFTGAEKRKPGRIELASKGTLFFDEIGELPLRLQGKLLQVIEQKCFTRLGGNKTIEIDVRIIAATNAPIEKMVADGRFRSDIFYRLNEYAIEIPPLRERREDIILLIQHFCDVYGSRYGRPNMKISPRTLSLFIKNEWRGNVRELESAVRRIALEGHEDTFQQVRNLIDSRQTLDYRAIHETIRETEMQAILAALTKTGWNRKKAGKILGMSYSSLRRRIKKYDLKRKSSDT